MQEPEGMSSKAKLQSCGLKTLKMVTSRSFGFAILCFATGIHAAVSSTGFTVSLTDINYFLPPKPVASIAGCEELKAAFAEGPFVPFTVVKGDGYGTLDLASATARYTEEDDVWQEGFLDGAYCLRIVAYEA